MSKTIKDLIKKLSNQVTTYIQNEWDETFPGVKVHFLSGFEGGCMTDNWIANVYFYSIENKDFYQGRRKTPTIRRIVCSVSEEASVSERLNEQGKPL